MAEPATVHHAAPRTDQRLAGASGPPYDPPSQGERDRPDRRGQREAGRDHFSFWQGPHACAGQGLARVELEVITEVVLERTRNLRLDPGGEPPRYRWETLRRWEPLHALFDAA